jgi:bifunctional non-homologous end joining protein LigD
MNPAEKHLAIRTEDDPLEYADFEGEIPDGQYGAGTVMVWDTARSSAVVSRWSGQEMGLLLSAIAGNR